MHARAIAGDARERKSYDALLKGERADLLFTDPPYCLLTRRRKHGDLRDPKGRKIDRDPVLRFETVRDYRTFTTQWLGPAVASLKGEHPLLLWTNFLGKEPLVTAARELGYGHLWGEFFWAKRGKESRGSEELLRVYETCLVLGRTPAEKLTPADRPVPWAAVSGYDDDGEAEATGSHPHHKPFSVLEPLLRAYSQPGDLVLDPFGGSGSIAACGLKLGRRVATMELKPDWAVLISRRLETLA